jgi:hypothetical protein
LVGQPSIDWSAWRQANHLPASDLLLLSEVTDDGCQIVSELPAVFISRRSHFAHQVILAHRRLPQGAFPACSLTVPILDFSTACG